MARRKAKAIMSEIQSGIDPTAEPKQSGITLEQALEAHIKENDLRPRSELNYRYHVDKYLTKFRKRAVADISRQDCRDLLDSLTRKSGRTSGAAVLRTLRALINTARRIDETIGANPIDAVKVPVPGRREVEELDIAGFWKQTATLSPLMRELQRAFLLTGARRSSLLSVRREDVDLEKRVLTFHHMKTGG